MDLKSAMFYDDEWISYNDGVYQFDWLNENSNPEANKMQLGVWWNMNGIIEYFVRQSTISSIDVQFSNSFKNADLQLRHSQGFSETHQLHLMIDYAKPQLTVDTYKYITAKNYTIVPLSLESEKDSPTRFYLFKNFNQFLQNKKKKYNGDITKAMEDFRKKEATFFEKGIHTFVENCMKYYNRGRRSIEAPQAYSTCHLDS